MASDTPKPSERKFAAASPSEAVGVIAEILDELAEQSASPPAEVDGWASWGKDAPTAERTAEEWTPDPKDEAELSQLEEELHGNADAEESRVLRAKIELCRDRLQPPPELHDNSGAATETHFDDDGTAIVELPKPTPEQIDERAQIVGRLGLIDQYGEEVRSAAEDSFVRGGPLLLYLSDREYVNSLPYDVKIALVEDVEKSSPREAQEMARDILKANTDDANDLTAATERIMGDVESGAIHNAP